jgi:hypothetical protein
MKNFAKIFQLSKKQQVAFRVEYDHSRQSYMIESSTYVRATFYREVSVYDSYEAMKNDFEYHMTQDNAENFYRYAHNEVDSLEDEQLGLDERFN